jgi:hypothetical protein
MSQRSNVTAERSFSERLVGIEMSRGRFMGVRTIKAQSSSPFLSKTKKQYHLLHGRCNPTSRQTRSYCKAEASYCIADASYCIADASYCIADASYCIADTILFSWQMGPIAWQMHPTACMIILLHGRFHSSSQQMHLPAWQIPFYCMSDAHPTA